jgi:hypothetical protein
MIDALFSRRWSLLRYLEDFCIVITTAFGESTP